MNRLLFERESPHVHNVPVVYLPGLPPTYVPPKAVWLVTRGISERQYADDTRDDYVPLGEAAQALLEACFAANIHDPFRYHTADYDVVIDSGETPASWQVRLSGTF